jgi:hypothetical protein
MSMERASHRLLRSPSSETASKEALMNARGQVFLTDLSHRLKEEGRRL